MSESARAERATVSKAMTAAVLPVVAQVELRFSASPDPVAGYRIYYGSTAGNYTDSVDLGSATSTRISGLVERATYYFAAVAYAADGLESKFSNEASYTVPAGAVTHHRLEQSYQVQYWRWPGAAGTLELSTNLVTVLVTITNSGGVVTNREVLVHTNFTAVGPIASGALVGITNNLARAFYRVRTP